MAFTGMSGNPLEVQIEGDSSDLQTAVATGKSSLFDLKKAAGVASAAMAGLAAGGLAKSITAAADFDAKMTESLAILGDVSSAMRKDMSAAAREVARTTQFSAEQAAESYFFLASAGLDAKESIEAMPNVANFAQAGMLDMATATDIATDAASALGIEMGELQGLTDQLVKANTLANASVEQFGNALTNKAAPAMKRLGVSTEEGIAALSVFADQGLKGDRAGTILARTLGGLNKQALKNSEAFERLGIRVFDSEGNMRSMQDITKDLEAALGDMSVEQRQAALEQLGFNRRAQQGIDLLLGNSDALAEYESELKNAGGTAQTVAEKQLDTLNQQWGLLMDSLNDVAISIGNVFLPALTSLVSKIVGAVQAFAKWNESMDGLPGAIGLVTTAVVGVTGALAAFVGGPITLVPGLVAAAAAAFKTDFAGIRTTTEQVLGAVSEELRKTMAVLDTVFGPAVDRARQAYREFANRIETGTSSIVSAIGDRLLKRFASAGQTIRTTLTTWSAVWKLHQDTVESVLTRVGEIVGAVGSVIADAYAGNWETARLRANVILLSLQDDVRAGLELAKQAAVTKLGELRARFEEKLDAALQKWDALKTRLPKPVREGIDGAIQAVQTKAGRIVQLWDQHSGNIREITTAVWDHVKTHPRDAVAALAFLLPGPLGTVVGLVSRNFTDIKNAAEGSMAKLQTAVSDAATGIKQLANGEFGAAFDSLKSAAENALDGIRTLLTGEGGEGGVINAGIRGAGEWLRGTGSELIKKGFEAVAGAAETVIEDLRIALVGANGAGGVFATVINQAEQTLSNSGDVLAVAAEEGFGVIETAMENVKIALIGEGGTGGGGGLVDTLIGNIADFLKSDAADRLAKATGKAFGTGIRLAALEVFNLLMWNDDSLIKTLIVDIVDYLKNDAPGDLKEAAKILWDQLVQTAEGVYEGLIDGEGPLFKNLVGDIVSYFKTDAKEDIKKGVKKLLEPITDRAEWVYDKLIRNSIIKDMISDIKSYFQNAGKEAIKKGFGDLIQQGLIDLANNFADWFINNDGGFWSDTIGSVRDWLKSTGDSWMSDAFSTIRGTIEDELNEIDLSDIKGALDTVISKASSAIETVKNIPDSVSTTINRTIKTRTEGAGGGDGVDDPGHGGATRGFAHGGIVTGPTRGILGEAGDPEAAIPLNRRGEAFMAGTIERALQSVAPASQSGGGGGDTMIIEEGAIQGVEDGQDVRRELEKFWREKERRLR